MIHWFVKSLQKLILNWIKMLKIATQCMRLTQKNKFTFVPPSCYNIESKPNPVINVVLGTDQADFCTIQFRVFFDIMTVILKCRSSNSWELQKIVTWKGQLSIKNFESFKQSSQRLSSKRLHWIRSFGWRKLFNLRPNIQRWVIPTSSRQARTFNQY